MAFDTFSKQEAKHMRRSGKPRTNIRLFARNLVEMIMAFDRNTSVINNVTAITGTSIWAEQVYNVWEKKIKANAWDFSKGDQGDQKHNIGVRRGIASIRMLRKILSSQSTPWLMLTSPEELRDTTLRVLDWDVDRLGGRSGFTGPVFFQIYP